MKYQNESILKIRNLKKKIFLKKKKIKLNKTDGWFFDDNIRHISNKFFKIFGYSIKTNFPKKLSYDQPLISQNEIGYLVIFKANIEKKSFFLLQLKVEPGNKNIIQLSPTIQATKSNYTRVHKGKKTKFIEYIRKKKDYLLDTNQPEQGSMYLNKLNKNLVIKTKKLKALPNNFMWLSKSEIKALSKKNNLLNMDTISIFSCYLKKDLIHKPINSFQQIMKKYKDFNKKFFLKIARKSLYKMKGWNYQEYQIYDKKKKFFKIESFNIKTNFREVNFWSQPLVSDYKKKLNVLFYKRKNNTSHYLSKIILEPGYNIPKFTSTIIMNNTENLKVITLFAQKNKINLSKKILDVIHSDEGGRFDNNSSKNIVYEVNNTDVLERQNYIWISYNQMLEMIKKKLVTIELRNLFGTLNIGNLK